MEDEKHRFYDDYEPVSNVSDLLNDPEEDYSLKAPYRDILGILESEQIWSDEDAIVADEILEKLEQWDNTERTRKETPPKSKKTIKNQLSDLYDDGLVMKIRGPRNSNCYWKVPDEDIPHPIRLTILKYGREIATSLRKLVCCHDLVLIAVVVYIIGTVVNMFYPWGSDIMIGAFLTFLVGHFMAYRDVSLFP